MPSATSNEFNSDAASTRPSFPRTAVYAWPMLVLPPRKIEDTAIVNVAIPTWFRINDRMSTGIIPRM